jgi:VCBS repeat-containing protein
MKKNFLFASAMLLMLGACNTEKSVNETTTTQADTSEMAGMMMDADHIPQRDLKYSDYAEAVNAGKITKDTLKTSARREATGSVGTLNVKINYGSPGVRGRAIWNGLVGYDQVWVTGAHTATKVEFDKDVVIGDKTITAGAYGFFTIPTDGEWTLILNKNYDQHLADDYKETEDFVRIKAKPTANAMTQRLTYTVEKTNDTEGSIAVTWDKIKVVMPFKVK